MSKIATDLTPNERAVVSDNPASAFGFMIETTRPVDTSSTIAAIDHQFGCAVTEPPFKLIGGHGVHVVTTFQGLGALKKELKNEGNNVSQTHLLRLGDNSVPKYDLKPGTKPVNRNTMQIAR